MTKIQLKISTLAITWVALIASFGRAATYEITTPFEGVRLIHSRSTLPRLLDVYVVEIDPQAVGIDFLVTPSNGDKVGEVTPQTVRAFVTGAGAQLGVNASFFALAPDQKKEFNILGLSASKGDVYSDFEADKLDALNISKDRVPTIIRALGKDGSEHRPDVKLYNAVGAYPRLVENGENVANANPAIHPRTAAGVTADGKLLLVTVDGRIADRSVGLTFRELGDLLIRWGARDATNLDGGGSTTLVMDDPATAENDPHVVNLPCDKRPDKTHGKERAVANSIAVFARKPAKPVVSEFVFADFEQGDAGTFSTPLGDSSASEGIDRRRSKAKIIDRNAHEGTGAQRLKIFADPPVTAGADKKNDAWFVRHASAEGIPANNANRPAVGKVGFWVRTESAGLRVSLPIDDAASGKTEASAERDVTADGEWHSYFWSFDEASDWPDRAPDSRSPDARFTLDSIRVLGPTFSGKLADATLDIDDVMQIVPARLPSK